MAQENPGETGKHRTGKAAPEATQDKPVEEQQTTATRSLPTVRTADGANTFASKAATVAAIGLGAALIEVEWIPGILIGVAAMLAPDLLPKVGQGLRPVVKGIVKAGYSLTETARETFAEAGEQLQDIVAEVRSEQHTGTPTPVGSKPAGPATAL